MNSGISIAKKRRKMCSTFVRLLVRHVTDFHDSCRIDTTVIWCVRAADVEYTRRHSFILFTFCELWLWSARTL